MAYRIKQKQSDLQELEIELLSGEIKTYKPQVELDEIVKEYKEFNKALSVLNLSSIEEYEGDYYFDIGNVIFKMMVFIFGQNQAENILNDFDGKYIELLLCLLPYINDEIKPFVDKVNEERENYYQNILK